MLELLERQQRLTVNQWKIISAAILGDMLDFFDFFLIGYVLAFIVGEWKLSFLESGMILLAAGIGAIPGAFFWGWMADRIGRRKVFVAAVLNFSLATGLILGFTMAGATGISSRIFCRTASASGPSKAFWSVTISYSMAPQVNRLGRMVIR